MTILSNLPLITSTLPTNDPRSTISPHPIAPGLGKTRLSIKEDMLWIRKIFAIKTPYHPYKKPFIARAINTSSSSSTSTASTPTNITTTNPPSSIHRSMEVQSHSGKSKSFSKSGGSSRPQSSLTLTTINVSQVKTGSRSSKDLEDWNRNSQSAPIPGVQGNSRKRSLEGDLQSTSSPTPSFFQDSSGFTTKKRKPFTIPSTPPPSNSNYYSTQSQSSPQRRSTRLTKESEGMESELCQLSNGNPITSSMLAILPTHLEDPISLLQENSNCELISDPLSLDRGKAFIRWEWNDSELDELYRGLEKFGPQFHKISKRIRTKTTAQTIEFYMMNKFDIPYYRKKLLSLEPSLIESPLILIDSSLIKSSLIEPSIVASTLIASSLIESSLIETSLTEPSLIPDDSTKL